MMVRMLTLCRHPVSYTHLDVYKRQDLDTEPLSSTITSNQKEEVVESDPSRLDVYKRQVAGRNRTDTA